MTRTSPLIRLLRGNRSVVRFAVVGVVNTALDLLVYLELLRLGLPIPLANLISTSTGMTFSYLANRHFTFRSTGQHRLPAVQQALLFLLVTGLGLWVLQPVVIVAVTAWMDGASFGAEGLRTLVPKLCGIAVGIVWNYGLYSRVVFRHHPPA